LTSADNVVSERLGLRIGFFHALRESEKMHVVLHEKSKHQDATHG